MCFQRTQDRSATSQDNWVTRYFSDVYKPHLAHDLHVFTHIGILFYRYKPGSKLHRPVITKLIAALQPQKTVV